MSEAGLVLLDTFLVHQLLLERGLLGQGVWLTGALLVEELEPLGEVLMGILEDKIY